MAASEVQICNNALVKLGAQLITSLSDDNHRAKLCNQVYTLLRDDLLRSHLWNFAMARETLAADVTAPSFGFTYSYTLPSDCIRVVKLYDHSGRYRIEGRKILSDSSTMKLEYVRKETDPGQFDELFAETLSSKIAAELAYSITASTTLAGQMQAHFDAKFRMAKMVDAQENFNDSIEANYWVDSRNAGNSIDSFGERED